MTSTVPAWLNAPFLENLLRNWQNNERISVVRTVIAAATGEGDNYSSNLYRVTLEYTYPENDKEMTEELSVIVKAALNSEGAYKEACEKLGVFDTEISMMTSTLKKMEASLDGVKLSAVCLYAQHEHPTLIVIEDLIPLGFRMADRHNGLDLQHCIIAMRGLAKFHAASILVCEKDPQVKKKYNKGLFSLDAPPEIISVFDGAVKRIAKLVATWPDIDQACRDKVMKLFDNAYQKAAVLRQADESELNVINHGDFWINNMLFRYDEQGKPIDVIFVDFQYSVYASPAVDLQYFLNTSPTEEVCINHTHELMHEYHRALSVTVQQLNCHIEIPKVIDLIKYKEKLEFYGFEAASLTLPVVLRKKREHLSEQSIRDGDEKTRRGDVNTPEYRRAMTRRLKYWNDMGFLDNWQFMKYMPLEPTPTTSRN